MEPIFDGGLIELFLALLLGLTMNYIFSKKYVLLFYSAISIIAPVLLCFFQPGLLFYIAVFLCLINTVFLLVLLWSERKKNPEAPLFDLKKIREFRL